MVLLRLLLIASALVCSTALAAEIGIIDGDTFDLGGTRYRIHGIDAPEAGQKCETGNGGQWDCGRASVDALEDFLISAGEVRCDLGTPDGYGRTISVCWADGLDVGRTLVRQGFAWAFVKFSVDYVAEEALARDVGIGIWRAETEPAWEFREKRWRSFGGEAPDPNCPIKGNINNQGERIYHPPWSQVYARTKVSPEKGERWFCDEGEAVAAGWRPAYWGRRG
jgi:endonuclease YncB( thermonuclease family)